MLDQSRPERGPTLWLMDRRRHARTGGKISLGSDQPSSSGRVGHAAQPQENVSFPNKAACACDTDPLDRIIGLLDEARRVDQPKRDARPDHLRLKRISFFWRILAPRLAHYNDAIKHALITLGAAHHSFETNATDDETQVFILRQYNASITALQTHMASTDPERLTVATACSLIFTTIDLLRLFSSLHPAFPVYI